ncbi:hypothetical protein [Sphingomonas hankookensis]|uniref:hypothetical protein n=1 Tax=Sphingomonas hankookensis TaxID=563996 RepID=UPI003F7AE8CB
MPIDGTAVQRAPEPPNSAEVELQVQPWNAVSVGPFSAPTKFVLVKKLLIVDGSVAVVSEALPTGYTPFIVEPMPLTLLLVPAFTTASCSSGVIEMPLTVVDAANCAAVIAPGVADGVGVGVGAGAGTVTLMLPAPGDATPSAPLHPASAAHAVDAMRIKPKRLLLAITDELPKLGWSLCGHICPAIVQGSPCGRSTPAR